jgi:VCBS repeat-containing protein
MPLDDTTINGQTEAITLNNVTRGVTAHLGDGDDVLELSGSSTSPLQLVGHSSIHLGNGDDSITFTNVSMLGGLTLLTGEGADEVTAELAANAPTSAVSLRVGGNAVIHTGGGADEISLTDANFGQNMILDAGLGDDLVTVEDSTFARLALLFGGPGEDSLVNIGNTFQRNPFTSQFEDQSTEPSPDAVNDTATVAENGTVTINVLSNDVAADAAIDATTVIITDPPASGTVVVNADGTIAYTQNGSEVTSDSFSYRVRDVDGNLSDEATVNITITGVNDAPTIANITDVVLAEDTASAPIAVTLGDAETPNNLTVTATSSNTAVVAASGIAITGTGTNRTLLITPVANASGTSTITLTVSDGTTTTTETFLVTVNATNDAPTISNVNDISVAPGGTISPITVTVGDVETPANVTLAATSSNQAIIANGGVAITGTGATRTVTLTPVANATGTTTITLLATDPSGATTTETFTVQIGNAPTVSAIADVTIAEDTSTTALAFTIGDVETAASNLQVTATSSNPALIPVSNIVLGGSGANRTVLATPVANASGTSTITLTVTDANGLKTTETFVVTVTPVNDAPVVLGENVNIRTDRTQQVTLNVLANDTDVDGPNPLAISAVAGGTVGQTFNGTYGTITLNANGSLTYTLNPDAIDDLLTNTTVEELITYTVSDGSATRTGVVEIDLRIR